MPESPGSQLNSSPHPPQLEKISWAPVQAVIDRYLVRYTSADGDTREVPVGKALLQQIFLTQESTQGLLHWQADSLSLS